MMKDMLNNVQIILKDSAIITLIVVLGSALLVAICGASMALFSFIGGPGLWTVAGLIFGIFVTIFVLSLALSHIDVGL
jgi:hypothetical protein